MGVTNEVSPELPHDIRYVMFVYEFLHTHINTRTFSIPHVDQSLATPQVVLYDIGLCQDRQIFFRVNEHTSRNHLLLWKIFHVQEGSSAHPLCRQTLRGVEDGAEVFCCLEVRTCAMRLRSTSSVVSYTTRCGRSS